MSEQTEPACPSCDIPWIAHLGIQGTCAKYRELLQASQQLKDHMETRFGYNVPDKVWVPFRDAVERGRE